MAEGDLHEGIGTPIGTPVIPGTTPTSPTTTPYIVKGQANICMPELGGLPFPTYTHMNTIFEEPFYGIEREFNLQEAYRIWTLRERCLLARKLDEAQEEIENQLGYPLSPRWFVDDLEYKCPLVLSRGKIIAAGTEAYTVLAEGAELTTGTDPYYATFTTTITDPTEIRIYYPTSEGVEAMQYEINPSDIDIDEDAGQVTIYIPRCRCVKPEYVNNPLTGHDYEDESFFIDEVDIYRVYNDESTHATLVYPHRDTCVETECVLPTCDEYTHDGCVYIRNADLGIVDIVPASYTASGGWDACTASCCGVPERVRVYYKAGLTTLSKKAQTAIARFAHTKMAKPICECERWMESWREDRNIPNAMTRERINNPFGLMDGAWHAWCFVENAKNGRSTIL